MHIFQQHTQTKKKHNFWPTPLRSPTERKFASVPRSPVDFAISPDCPSVAEVAAL